MNRHQNLASFTIARVVGSLTILAILSINTPATADTPATVSLVSGKSYTAQIDVRTSTRRLWIRFEENGTLLLRPIDWSDVKTIGSGWIPRQAAPPTTPDSRPIAEQVLELLRDSR